MSRRPDLQHRAPKLHRPVPAWVLLIPLCLIAFGAGVLAALLSMAR